MKPQIPWLRVFVEGVVIVGSILLAFGIDAWWEGRGDRVAEREALEQLVMEFQENRERIDPSREGGGTFRRAEAASETIHALMQALPSDENTLLILDTLLVRVVRSTTFDPVTPVLDGLIRSGRLEVIRDRRVRDAISTWGRWLAQLEETERQSWTFNDTRLRPALLERGELSKVFAAGGAFGTPPMGLDPHEGTVLRVDDELKGLVAERYANDRAIIALRERLRDTVDGLLDAIADAQAR